MELILRTCYHAFMTYTFNGSGMQNITSYKNNIKRMRCIITNDYGNFIGEEFPAESEGSCSMVSESFSNDKDVFPADDFEYPERIQGDESECNSERKPNESQN